MFNRQTDNFMTRVTHALNRPLQSRCAELTVLFDRASVSELHSFFPILIDHIFGPQGSLSWGLRMTTANVNSLDFQTLQHFLSPLGPLFKIIYLLLRDPHIKYEFNVQYLPLKVRQMLNSTSTHPFYTDLVHVNVQTRQVTSLLLNPFDYYFFHFAHHLINPWHQRAVTTTGSLGSWSTVYYILCCDYVIHFLPTDPSMQVLPLIDFYCGKNPIDHVMPFNRPVRTSNLLRTSVLNESVDFHMHQTFERHPRNEIWRSETVMMVFLDMWLSNDQINTLSQQNFMRPQSLQFNELPTGEYIRIIRVLVKQLHAFASSAKIDDTHMSELKKISTPMLQTRVYVFLRNLIHRWPLDGSFRLVLELWLSFIQPWRYQGSHFLKSSNQVEPNPDVEDMGVSPIRSVDREYIKFIAENLLAYVVIFQQLLPRFCRVDLASPKMSLMLYRMTKVFDQPNLVAYLREIEASIENYRMSPTHSYQRTTNLPPLSPTSNWSTNTAHNEAQPHESLPKQNLSELYASTWSEKPQFSNKWSAVVRQRIYELEGASFQYKPLFTQPPAYEVFELMEHVWKSKVASQEIVEERLRERELEFSGFFGQIKAFLICECSNDEFTMEERQKVPLYLDFALQNLTDMFQITQRQAESVSLPDLSSQSGTFSITNDLRFLTPEKVKERVRNIRYEGDPELLPTCTYENNFLVTVLRQLSTYINIEFQPQIQRYYHRNDYTGRILRQMLCPPMTIYSYDKSKPGRSPRVARQLPPRVSFRGLASHKFLVYMFLGYGLSYLLGYSLPTFLFLVVAVWVLKVLVLAVPSRGGSAVPTVSISEVANNSFE